MTGSESTRLQNVYELIGFVTKKRLRRAASEVQEVSSSLFQNPAEPIVNPSMHAVNWIRSVEQFSFVNETSVLSRLKVLSENMALVDFLELSLKEFCRPGQCEWPVWCGQITVDSYVTGSRMRNSARVFITAPMQSPSFIPGCNLIKNRTPGGIFRCEPYNIVLVPPWGRLRAMNKEDAHVLRPVGERLEHVSQVAVPAGYHNDEILDIRIIPSVRARQLLAQMPWKPKSRWILDDHVGVEKKAYMETGLVCGWHEDTMEIHDDRQYVSYVVDLLKAMERLEGQRHHHA